MSSVAGQPSRSYSPGSDELPANRQLGRLHEWLRRYGDGFGHGFRMAVAHFMTFLYKRAPFMCTDYHGFCQQKSEWSLICSANPS